MKKFLKLVIFLTLSTFSFANWEVDREHDMIFTYSIKSEPTQKGVLYIRKGSYDILNYYSLYILTDKYPAFTEKIDEDKTMQKTKIELVTEHPIEFERNGIVNMYKPNEIFILLIDDEMEIFKRSKTLKVIYKDRNLSPCYMEFDITELEKAIKKIKVKKLPLMN